MADDNLTHLAYIHIHEKLDSGKLAPGTRLSHRKVAKEMGFTASPVRGALTRLISEGVLDHQPGLGVFVPAPSQREIEEVYELRRILECAAVAKVCGKLDDKTLSEMKRCVDRQEGIYAALQAPIEADKRMQLLEDWAEMEFKFHKIFLRAASNRKMFKTVDDLWRRFRIIGHHLIQEKISFVPRRVMDEHAHILKALQQGDAAEAVAALANHIQIGCEDALKAHNKYYMEQPRGTSIIG